MNEEQLIETAGFGEEVEDFFKSNVGMYLLECIDAKVDELKTKLTEIKPFQHKTAREVLAEVNALNNVKQFISDAIIAGRNAADLLDNDN